MPGKDLIPSLFERGIIKLIFAPSQANSLKGNIFWLSENKFVLWQKWPYWTLKCGHYSYLIWIQWTILFLSFSRNIKKQIWYIFLVEVSYRNSVSLICFICYVSGRSYFLRKMPLFFSIICLIIFIGVHFTYPILHHDFLFVFGKDSYVDFLK